MVILLDNIDSFTYNLADYLAQCGVTCRVVRNHADVAQLAQEAIQAIVLSPGPGTPRQAGNLMEVVAHFAHQVPVLGICLGHQALGEFFGATLTRASKPMHGKLSTIRCQPDYLFAGLPAIQPVVRYHSLLLQQLPDCLENIAETESGELMALRHKSLPIRGIQFHPEAFLTTHGLAMVRNWVKFNQLAG